MKQTPDIGKKVDNTLESLEGIQRAEPRPYFFTRVKARLERGQKGVWETIGSVMARPAIAIAGLFIILAVNATILIEKETPTNQTVVQENVNTQEEENIFAVNTSDYENLEP